MATMEKSSIARQLSAASLAINNTIADKELGTLVAAYGYNAAKMDEGRQLYLAAADAVKKQTFASGAHHQTRDHANDPAGKLGALADGAGKNRGHGPYSRGHLNAGHVGRTARTALSADDPSCDPGMVWDIASAGGRRTAAIDPPSSIIGFSRIEQNSVRQFRDRDAIFRSRPCARDNPLLIEDSRDRAANRRRR